MTLFLLCRLANVIQETVMTGERSDEKSVQCCSHCGPKLAALQHTGHTWFLVQDLDARWRRRSYGTREKRSRCLCASHGVSSWLCCKCCNHDHLSVPTVTCMKHPYLPSMAPVCLASRLPSAFGNMDWALWCGKPSACMQTNMSSKINASTTHVT